LLVDEFGSLVECTRSWLVQMSSRRLPSSMLADEFGSLGTNMDYGSYWGTPLGIIDCGRDKFYPRVDYRWWPIVGGASRHSWQQRSINVLIKGCRIKRRLEGDLKVLV